MKSTFFLLACALSLVSASFASASETLVVNAAEFGIGKFHRYSNKLHSYGNDHAWKPYVLADGADTSKPLAVENVAGENYTIFFNTLEELMRETVALSLRTGKKVGVLNLHAHGVPGGTWFPANDAFRDSMECAQWANAAQGSDRANFDQYYSPVSLDDIAYYDELSEQPSSPGFQCITGLPHWKRVLGDVPAFKDVFADRAQLHFMSCVVGKGSLGDRFTQGLATLLFTKPGQQIETSIKFGIGDWSMVEGMGFWGYESDAQIESDAIDYPRAQRDRGFMQKGDIRVARIGADGAAMSGLIAGQDFLYPAFDTRAVSFAPPAAAPDLIDLIGGVMSEGGGAGTVPRHSLRAPRGVRIPGTGVELRLAE